jgi:hypothetical protein
MAKKRLCAALAIVVVFLLLPGVSGAAGEFQRDALRGLKGVYVAV